MGLELSPGDHLTGIFITSYLELLVEAKCRHDLNRGNPSKQALCVFSGGASDVAVGL